MTQPVPGGRPADAERLAAARAAADAVVGPDTPADPEVEADRFQALHDALVDLLAAADPADDGRSAASGPAPGGAPRGPG